MAEIKKLKEEAPGVVTRFIILLSDVSKRIDEQNQLTDILDHLSKREWGAVIREIGEQIDRTKLGDDFLAFDKSTEPADRKWMKDKMDKMKKEAMYIELVFLNVLGNAIDYCTEEEANRMACYLLYFYKSHLSMK